MIFFGSILQGTIVDRIDYNIEQVATSINAGVKELEKVPLGVPHPIFSMFYPACIHRIVGPSDFVCDEIW